MASQQSLGLWSDVSLPQWMINHPNIQEELSFQLDSQKQKNKKNREYPINSPKPKQHTFKRFSSVQNQSQLSNSFQRLEDIKVQEYLSPDSQQKVQRSTEENSKSKLQKRCQNSRKYRQKKRKYMETLEEENKFLKAKIDQLHFRLNQKQREINRLKHKDLQNTQTFHKIKQDCLREVEDILTKNKASHQQLSQAEKKLRKVLSFDSRHKVEYLNYFMGEIMQNILNDTGFYFMDCLINKIGVYRQSTQQDLRRIDNEVLSKLNISEEKLKQFLNSRNRVDMAGESKRLKDLWKKLYQVYSAILNQGMRLQRIVQPMRGNLTKLVGAQSILALELHFEKNKYRSDIRYLRNSWFKQLQYESIHVQKQNEQQPTKKIKII